jgi:hypothetical protein
MKKTTKSVITCLAFGFMNLVSFIITKDDSFFIVCNVFLAASFVIGVNSNETS